MRTRLRSLLAAITPLLLATLSATAQDKPPVAPAVRDVTDTYFGKTIADPYRYFENVKNPEVAAYMKAEADYADAVLERIAGPRHAARGDRATRRRRGSRASSTCRSSATRSITRSGSPTKTFRSST